MRALNWFEDYKREELRSAERARFDRAFVDTPYGTGYFARCGQLRSVKPDELAAWRGEAYARIDRMIAETTVQAIWAAAAFLIVTLVGAGLLDRLELFEGRRMLLLLPIAVATMLVMVGLDFWDYWRDLAHLRARVETAVVGRAPLGIDPARVGSRWNPYELAKYAVVIACFAVVLWSLADERLFAYFSPLIAWPVIALAWGLHYAAKWHDRRTGRLPAGQ